MAQITGLDLKIQEMAKRIKELREIENVSVEEMAQSTGVSVEEYTACENGQSDLNFAFLYRCSLALKINVTDIIEGYSPKLRSYSVTRFGSEQEVAKAHGMTYYNLAYNFQDRIAEPLYVKMDYDAEAEHRDIELTSHEGQECDIVITGRLTVQIGEHRETLNAGDSIYYNSDTSHGMIAAGGKSCTFYAIVLNPSGEPNAEYKDLRSVVETAPVQGKKDDKERIYQRYIDVVETETGYPTSITFKNTEHFNFGFDLVDALADKDPTKLAMLHIAKDKTERRFTFKDIKRESNRCANYFRSLGIRKGDRVMLVLKRHYQFWFAMIGLNKLGAIAIPATNQLQEHDFEYRFKAAGVSAILCTADGDTAHQVDIAAPNCPELVHKILVGGKREGWRDFD